MLPTFVIGLREGLEAALIVGIIAAFLRQQGRRDLLRAMAAGIVAAVGLCVAVGVGLRLYSAGLPQRQQEGLETVIGVLAVTMVTYMVAWMRHHSRGLRGQLEGLAAQALAGRSNAGRAMVVMAFLAVIREGTETVVFLLAAFDETGSTTSAGTGACLGIAVAVAVGYGIYRGGVRLNLSRFFRVTGLVLVLVAAGLVVNALHTAHEAGWLNVGQRATVDLSGLVRPGSVQASLLTGMLGVQARPVVIEVVGWLLYLVPVGLYVAWPAGKAVPARLLAWGGAAVAGVAAAVALVAPITAPDRPVNRAPTAGGGVRAVVVSRTADAALVRVSIGSTTTTVRLADAGPARRDGLAVRSFRARTAGADGAHRPATLDTAAVARLNGGRLPLGLNATAAAALPVTYRDTAIETVWIDLRTDRVVDLVRAEQVTATVTTATGAFMLGDPVASSVTALPAATVASAVAAAGSAHRALDRRALLHHTAAWCVLVAAAALAAAAAGTVIRRRDGTCTGAPAQRPVLVS